MAAYSEEIKNGGSETYTYTFDVISTDYVKVDILQDGVFVNLPNDGQVDGWESGDPEYPWTIDEATETVKFTGTLTPDVDNSVRIYRETSLDSLPITFQAGSALSAEQLNENFQVCFQSTQEIDSQYLTASTGKLQQNLDANSKKIVNVADGTADNDAVNKSQLDAVATGAQDQADDAEASADLAKDWATKSTAVEGELKSAKSYAEEAKSQRDWIEDNDDGTLRDTVFWGFRRTAAGNLLVDYTPTTTANSIDKETGDDGSDTYTASDYLHKGVEHWAFMPAGSIDQGTNEPRLSFSNGHLNYDI